MDSIPKPYVSLRDLMLGYTQVPIIKDFSLDIENGELLTILGPSGCGKTTILKFMAGLLTALRGKLLIDGVDFTHVPAHNRNIGMVFQNLALFPHMTVFENIAFPLAQRHFTKGEIQNKVMSIVRKVGLEEYIRQYPKHLSGGEQQRLALARTLVFSPPVLLLDEPLGGLDKKLKDDLLLEIKRLHTELKTTIIYVTHDQTEAMTISDRIAVMSKGILQQLGKPQEIYEVPVNTYVADFIGEANFFRGSVLSLNHNVATIVSKNKRFYSEIDSSIIRLLAVGNNVNSYVRPEKVSLIQGTETPSNKLEGKVISSSFLGEYVRYLIQIEDGMVIRMKQQAGNDYIRSPGEKVTVAWQAKDMRIVTDS